jgi:CheY-specific phosphatase CheX
MVTHNLEEIAYLKVSEPALQKIEKIKAALRELNCTIDISMPVIFEKNIMEFSIRISFPVT